MDDLHRRLLIMAAGLVLGLGSAYATTARAGAVTLPAAHTLNAG